MNLIGLQGNDAPMSTIKIIQSMGAVAFNSNFQPMQNF